MGEQLIRVERKVRRPDHSDSVCPRLGGMLGELNGVCGVLRPAVDSDLELSAAGKEQLGRALALVDVEEHALPRRPKGQ